eukprot:g32265.t1
MCPNSPRPSHHTKSAGLQIASLCRKRSQMSDTSLPVPPGFQHAKQQTGCLPQPKTKEQRPAFGFAISGCTASGKIKQHYMWQPPG